MPGYAFQDSGFGWLFCGPTQGTIYCGPAIPNSTGQPTSIDVHGLLEVDANAFGILQGPADVLAVDLTALPVTPAQAAHAGETWHFQCWHRDGATSNFSPGLRVVFR